MPTYQIIMNWNYVDQDDLIDQRERAAVGIGYKDEITDDDPESPTSGELIPNPISKAQAIKNKLKEYLMQLIEAGTAINADQYRVDELEAIKTRIDISVD